MTTEKKTEVAKPKKEVKAAPEKGAAKAVSKVKAKVEEPSKKVVHKLAQCECGTTKCMAGSAIMAATVVKDGKYVTFRCINGCGYKITRAEYEAL